jgi:hypothetical protein
MTIFGIKFKSRGGWIVPAITGAAALYNVLKKKPKAPSTPTIDVSGILAEIDKMYDTQETATQANLARSLAGTNKATSDSLAGRGVYSSPVSEWSFAKNRGDYQSALSDALATIAGSRAGAKANVLSSAKSLEAKQKYKSELNKYNQKLSSSNMLTGLLASAAMSSLGGGGTPAAGGGGFTPEMLSAGGNQDLSAILSGMYRPGSSLPSSNLSTSWIMNK